MVKKLNLLNKKKQITFFNSSFTDGHAANPTLAHENFLKWINKNNINLYGTTLEANESHFNYNWDFPLTIAMGNEQKGLSNILKENSKNEIKIITKGRMKSLNISVATALIIHEINRKFPI